MLCLIMLRYVMFFIQESGEHDMFNSRQLQPNKRSMQLEVATVPEALKKTSQIQHLHQWVLHLHATICNDAFQLNLILFFTSTTFILISFFKFVLCEVSCSQKFALKTKLW